MTPERKQALVAYLLALADDELILAHRNSEWTGHGPILEEDIAFSNIAQDEMGHATLWYELVSDLLTQTPDELVFFRDAPDYRNVQMVELPKGDWAFSLLRQYLFDVAEMVRLSYLVDSAYEPIAHTAVKIRPEEIYHLRHTSLWVKRLGLGTEESNGRMQKALNTLWPYAHQLFSTQPYDQRLLEANIIPDITTIQQEWEHIVRPFLTDADLHIPHDNTPPTTERSEHTSHLDTLLQEMQMVARFDPQATW